MTPSTTPHPAYTGRDADLPCPSCQRETMKSGEKLCPDCFFGELELDFKYRTHPTREEG